MSSRSVGVAEPPNGSRGFLPRAAGAAQVSVDWGMALLECVPNVSEGRRPEVIAALADAVSVSGVRRLDLTSDPDHHRSVLTLVGEAEDLITGLLRLYEVALSTIDLAEHQGVHPRVGIVDVVPFVPLAGSTMAEAVSASRRLAAEVARRFDLPVYLYEEAATRPERRSLAAVRRGGLSGLRRRLELDASTWAPDFGPHRLAAKTGATVIGARFFLIAWNAVLDTADLRIARQVARAIRASNGGLPAVRAIGVELPSRGRTQVSLNLLDFRQTSLATAFKTVEYEAARRGARVLETELIGLLPEEAALGSLAELLRLPSLPGARVLERAFSSP